MVKCNFSPPHGRRIKIDQEEEKKSSNVLKLCSNTKYRVLSKTNVLRDWTRFAWEEQKKKKKTFVVHFFFGYDRARRNITYYYYYYYDIVVRAAAGRYTSDLGQWVTRTVAVGRAAAATAAAAARAAAATSHRRSGGVGFYIFFAVLARPR